MRLMRVGAAEGERALSEILSQAEIEALLASLTADAGEHAAQPAPARTTTRASSATPDQKRYRQYEFGRPYSAERHHSAALQRALDQFGRLAGTCLSVCLRAPIRLSLSDTEQCALQQTSADDYRAAFCAIDLRPCQSAAIIAIELPLALAMVDRMLGGPGTPLDKADLTEIELRLLRQAVQRLCQPLQAAVKGMTHVEPCLTQIDISMELLDVDLSTSMHLASYEMRFGNHRGDLRLWLPEAFVKLGEAHQTQGKRKAAVHDTAQSRVLIEEQLAGASVGCKLMLGKAQIPLGEFLRLEPGDIVQLESGPRDEAALLVEDVPKFRGKPAMQGEQLVFSVTKAIG